ncbi:MAG: DUF2961 domain-containing protein [Planctomycetota bacterium]
MQRIWTDRILGAILWLAAGGLFAPQLALGQGPPDEGPPPDVSVAGLVKEFAHPQLLLMPGSKDWHLVSQFHNPADKPLVAEKTGRAAEYSLAKFEGPGALVRLWIANASGHLSFYLDGAPRPSLRVDLKLLRSGQFQVFEPPFSEAVGKGVVFRFPIPFIKSLEIRTENDPAAWTADCRRYPDGSSVHPFDTKSAAAQLFFVVREDAEILWALTKPKTKAAKVQGSHPAADASLSLKPSESKTIFEASDGGLLEEVSFEHFLPFLSADQLAGLVIEVEADGKQRVSVPLIDFFAEARKFQPGRERWTKREVLFEGICRRRTARWPMPFEKSLKLSVANRGDVAVPAMRFFFQQAKNKPEAFTHYFRAESFEREIAFSSATTPLVLLPHLASKSRVVADLVRTSWGQWDRKGPVVSRGSEETLDPLAATMAHYLSMKRFGKGRAIRAFDLVFQPGESETRVIGHESETLLMRQRMSDYLSLRKGDRFSIPVGWDGKTTRTFRGSLFYFEARKL